MKVFPCHPILLTLSPLTTSWALLFDTSLEVGLALIDCLHLSHYTQVQLLTPFICLTAMTTKYIKVFSMHWGRILKRHPFAVAVECRKDSDGSKTSYSTVQNMCVFTENIQDSSEEIHDKLADQNLWHLQAIGIHEGRTGWNEAYGHRLQNSTYCTCTAHATVGSSGTNTQLKM